MNRQGLLVWALSLCAFAPLRLSAPLRAQRPPVEITTTAAFDAKTIPAYRGTHPEIYGYIDAHQPEHVANLQRWLRQPSVSAQHDGITKMAELVRDDLRKLGCAESELVPTSGHPGGVRLLRRGSAEDPPRLHDVRRAAGRAGGMAVPPFEAAWWITSSAGW